MLDIIGKRQLRRLAVATLAAAAVSSPAQAANMMTATPASCPSVSAPATVFARWGDRADYVLLPGGAFETGAGGWSGGTVVSGNESFKVGGASHAKSLAIPAGGSVTSASMCLGVEHPTFRFFARSAGGPTAFLKVELLYRNAAGKQISLMVGMLSGGAFSDWKPVDAMVAGSGIPLLAGEKTLAGFRFTSTGTAATWQVDDVYVDPFRAG
jgi:hypothetical protein